MEDQGSQPVATEAQILEKLDQRFNPEPAPETVEQETDDVNLQATEEPQAAQEQAEAEPEAEDADEGQDESQPDLSAVKVPVTFKDESGNEVTEELPLDELRSGYMRQRDYTLKTQEVSKARAAIPQAVEQGVSEARNQYVQALTQFNALVQQVAAPELASVDWQKLAQENPAEYVRLQARASQVQNAQAAINQHIQAENQKAVQAQQQRLQEESASAVELLRQNIPDFTLDKYNGILSSAVREYGKYGLTREEVAGITGAVPILVLNDALAYRALKAKQPLAQKQLAKAPLPIKPGPAKARSEVDQARIAPLKARLAQTGDLEDAERLYAARQRKR